MVDIHKIKNTYFYSLVDEEKYICTYFFAAHISMLFTSYTDPFVPALLKLPL